MTDYKNAYETLTAKLSNGEASDGYHTHNELYDYRVTYNALAFNAAVANNLYPVTKSWRHADGELCFGGGWFVVTAELPTGQVTNHYQADHWRLFKVPEVDNAPEWDGHSPEEALDRLKVYLSL